MTFLMQTPNNFALFLFRNFPNTINADFLDVTKLTRLLPFFVGACSVFQTTGLRSLLTTTGTILSTCGKMSTDPVVGRAPYEKAPSGQSKASVSS